MTRRETSPKQLRLAAWIVCAMALFVLLNIVGAELSHARLEATGVRVQARITRIDARPTGRRIDHVMHYAFEVDGRTYPFSEDSDRERLEELHTATWNGFVGPDAPFEVGKTLPLLVDPREPGHHRPDRSRLPNAWLLFLRGGLALMMLGGLSAWLFRTSRSRPGALGLQREASLSVHTRDETLHVHIELDIPWPHQTSGDAMAALRARLPTRNLGPKSQNRVDKIASARVDVLLRPARDGQILEACVTSKRAEQTLGRTRLSEARPLKTGLHERLHVALPVAPDATSLEIEVRLAGGEHWTRVIPVRSEG